MIDLMIRAIWSSVDGTFGDSVFAKFFGAVISIIGGLIATGLFVAVFFYVRSRLGELLANAPKLIDRLFRMLR
jgi:hypothetical protein